MDSSNDSDGMSASHCAANVNRFYSRDLGCQRCFGNPKKKEESANSSSCETPPSVSFGRPQCACERRRSTCAFFSFSWALRLSDGQLLLLRPTAKRARWEARTELEQFARQFFSSGVRGLPARRSIILDRLPSSKQLASHLVCTYKIAPSTHQRLQLTASSLVSSHALSTLCI